MEGFSFVGWIALTFGTIGSLIGLNGVYRMTREQKNARAQTEHLYRILRNEQKRLSSLNKRAFDQLYADRSSIEKEFAKSVDRYIERMQNDPNNSAKERDYLVQCAVDVFFDENIWETVH